ncbi:MAG: hypothetical protein OQL18_00600 [Deltaproteobacteria bacterium]|jgi:hypothetical protein|nr:hypothetical protein [Deltaproteobacteria bacterium]
MFDPEVVLIGYQANFIRLEKGLFLFNHSCQSTLSVEVGAFSDLYDGPIYGENLTGSDSCPGHCLYENNSKSCPEKCECAYVREILILLEKPEMQARLAG